MSIAFANQKLWGGRKGAGGIRPWKLWSKIAREDIGLMFIAWLIFSILPCKIIDLHFFLCNFSINFSNDWWWPYKLSTISLRYHMLKFFFFISSSSDRYGFSFRNVELSSIHSTLSKSYSISPIPPNTT